MQEKRKATPVTKHMDKRMNQRGISGDMVIFTCDFGKCEGDRYTLNRKMLDGLISEFQHNLRTAKKLRDKGGITVVEESNRLLTAFRIDSFRRKAR